MSIQGWWTPERVRVAEEVLKKHSDINSALGAISEKLRRPVSYYALLKALKRYGSKRKNGKKRSGLTCYLDFYVPPKEVEKVEFKPTTAKKWTEPLTDGEVKTLIIGDLQIPCQNDAAIEEVMEREQNADQLVVNGDILDVDQISHFGSNRDGSLRQEYNRALAMLVEWSLMFKRVYVNWGNHDFRPENYKRKWVNRAAHFLFGNLIDNLVNGIQYGEASGNRTGQVDIPNVFGDGGPEGWWTLIGDCVVAHPRSFYKKPGETARRVLRHFQSRWEGVTTAIIGHTHMLWEERRRSPLPVKDMGDITDWLVVEAGCLCNEMDYTKEGKLNYEKPRELGYAVLYQVDGVTDKRRTEYRSLGGEG